MFKTYLFYMATFLIGANGVLSSASADTVLVYNFNAGSLFNFGGGNTFANNGSFVYDVTQAQVIAVSYEAVQKGSGPAGPYDFISATTVSPSDVIFNDDGLGNEFTFAKSLATGGSIAITGGGYYDSGNFVQSVAASGFVTSG